MRGRRIDLTGRGWALLIAGVVLLGVGVAFGRSDAMFGAATLIGVLAGSWVAVRIAGPQAFFMRVMPPDGATRGVPVPVGLTPVAPAAVRALMTEAAVEENGFKPLARWWKAGEKRTRPVLGQFSRGAGAVLDRTPWGDVAASPGRSGAALGYTFAPPARGVFRLGPARSLVLGPMGLVTASYVASRAVSLVVAPAILPIDVPQPDPDTDRQQLRSAASAERVTDPAAVRDYQSGDPRRLVHWKATARRDRLMVRDTITRGLPDVWVLVDDTAAPGEAAEQALDVAASVAIRLWQTRHTVRLINVSGTAAPRRFDPVGGRDAILEAFALVELGTGRTASDEGSATWVQRLVTDLGGRGATGAVYGAFGHVDAVLLEELRQAAALAEPAMLWLVAGSVQERPELAAAGWTVNGVAR
jgi:hypothetical protein